MLSYPCDAAFLLVLLGGILSTVGLAGGEWVGARLKTTNGNESSRLSFGFGPQGMCFTDDQGSRTCTSPSELESRWQEVRPLLNPLGDPSISSENVGTLLTNVRNLMIASVSIPRA